MTGKPLVTIQPERYPVALGFYRNERNRQRQWALG